MNELNIDKGTISILLISDTHYGNPRPIIDAGLLTPLIKENKYNMMFHLGDIINGCKKDENNDIIYEQLAIARKQMEKIVLPKYFITGNHDYHSFENIEFLLKETLQDATFLGQNNGHICINKHAINLCHLVHNFAIYSPSCRLKSNGAKIIIQGHYHLFRCVSEYGVLRINLPTLSNTLTFSPKEKGVADLTIDFENETYQVRNYVYDNGFKKAYDLTLSYKY